MLREDEVLEYSVLKELKVPAKEMARWDVKTKRVTGFGESQRRKTAELERRVENSERQPVDPKTASRKSKGRRRVERGSGSENRGGTSSEEASSYKLSIV